MQTIFPDNTTTDQVPLGNKLEYEGITFYMHDPLDCVTVFIETVNDKFKNKECSFVDYVIDILNKYYTNLPMTAIEFIICLYAVPVRDEQYSKDIAKIQLKSERLQSLIITTTTFWIISRSNDPYCLTTVKIPIKNSLENWKNLEKISINTCVSFMDIIITKLEKKIGISYEKASGKILLTSSEKRLFNTYANLKPYSAKGKTTYKQLLYLFITDTAFVDSIKSFDNGSYTVQLRRYLYELLLWLRIIDICKSTVKTKKDIVLKREMSDLTSLLKKRETTGVSLNKENISKKMMSKILFLLHEAMEAYTYRNVIGIKGEFVMRLLQDISQKQY